jgi:hypothetical protein
MSLTGGNMRPEGLTTASSPFTAAGLAFAN